MTINERFSELIKTLYKGNKRAFATAIGVSATVVENVVGKRQGKPSYDVIDNVCAKANISPEWLLTGRGSMLRADGASIPVATPATSASEGIPLIPLNAMAGFASGELNVLNYECEHYVVPAFREADYLIPVKGSSMQPKYNSGDIVACKKVPLNDIFFQWNKVYVLDTIQGALIKRIKRGTTSDSITLVSENARYEPFELKISQIHAVAIVVGVIRLE